MQHAKRRGVSRIEAAVVGGVVGLLAAVTFPMVLSARESARASRCRANLRQLGLALHAYHDAYAVLPPAAVWDPGPYRSMALQEAKRVDLVTRENWVRLVLPHLGRNDVADRFAAGLPVGAAENEAARTAPLDVMTCPSDEYNRPDNPHAFQPVPGRPVRFARGNYAINGGTHCFRSGPDDTAFRTGDASHLTIDPGSREFRMWGNGVAGFNVCFSLGDFTNGTSTLVALEEVRAGVHPLDPRGSWALGQVGGSVTWAHGVNGDAGGPNNPWPRSDDLLGCGKLHEAVGREFLAREKMPCVWYLDVNQNATARSRHAGGVHVLTLDGAARFVSDDVDPGLWHVTHSRETPPEVLSGDYEARLASREAGEAPAPNSRRAPDAKPLSTVTNSLGMEFVLLPAGEFLMGLPDAGNDYDLMTEAPAHRVRITRPFYLASREVTAAQAEEIFEAARRGESLSPERAVEPARGVTWDRADKFCRRLSERPEEQAAGRRYRLPTEAEWEYACRAGSREPYRWSAQRAAGEETGEAAGVLPPLPVGPVGTHPPNAWGLYDMRGNVWEWTADWFDPGYYARSPLSDPRGPAAGYLKVVRGGDWRFVGEGCKIDYAPLPSWKASPFVGFRVVCELIETDGPGTAEPSERRL